MMLTVSITFFKYVHGLAKYIVETCIHLRDVNLLSETIFKKVALKDLYAIINRLALEYLL